MKDYKYDVALSFAGEDRQYVEEVAKYLEDDNIKVYYDRFEEVDAWGKDLGVHFDTVYRKSSKYCVAFLSKHYAEKVWTRHELRTAFSRALESNEEYLLPARFDDTKIEGLRPTISYVSLKEVSPQQLARMIILKLKKEPSKSVATDFQVSKGKVNLSVNLISQDYSSFNGVGLKVHITSVEKEDRYYNEPVFALSEDFNGADTLYISDKIKRVTFPVKLEYGQVVDEVYFVRESAKREILDKLDENSTIKAIVTTTLGEEFESNEVAISEINKGFNMMKKR